MKISYTAFLRSETINELFLKQILKTYYECVSDNQNEQDAVMEEVIKGKADLKFMVWIMHRRLLETVFKFPKLS